MKWTKNSAATAATVLGLATIGLAAMRRWRTASATTLKGKVVLITGGSRGLGFALAREFASHGARLALTSRTQQELDRAKSRLIEECGMREEDIFVLACDVGRPEDVSQLVAAVTAFFGQVDILINNAGVILVGPLESHTLASFDDAMRTNFFGAVHCALAVLPQMVGRGDGAIVNIASVGGKVAFPHLLPYVASKFALVGWSQGMRTELGPKGVKVLTVNPGVMRNGSHIQARFTGDAEREYRWFAAVATLPALAVEGSSAAKQIIDSLLRNSAETSIGIQALLAARLSNVAPELTAALLSLANSLLPHSRAALGEDHKEDALSDQGTQDAVSGARFRYSLPKVIQQFGEDAIHRYNHD